MVIVENKNGVLEVLKIIVLKYRVKIWKLRN